MVTWLLASLSTASAGPCRAAPLVVAEAMGTEQIEERRCAWIDLDFAGRAFAQLPDVGIARGLALQRTRAELGLRAGADVQTRLALLTARSGGDTGYIGINGESIVPILQIAEARWDWRDTGLAVAAGLVDDIWVMTLQPTWGRVDTLRPLVTDSGFQDRSDTGGWLSWTAPGGLFTATTSVTTGEGANRRERNGGSDVAGVLRFRPVSMASDAPVDLEIAAYGREGSRGIGKAPDHRAGAAILVRHPYVNGGIDGLLGWGCAATARCARPASPSGRARAPRRRWWPSRATIGAPTTAPRPTPARP
ncbi:MAG: hypothetical protein R3F59_05455 [Myxococcota bacterium]